MLIARRVTVSLICSGRLPKRSNSCQTKSGPDWNSDPKSSTFVSNVHFAITINIEATSSEIPVGKSGIAGGFSVEVASGKTNTFTNRLQLVI